MNSSASSFRPILSGAYFLLLIFLTVVVMIYGQSILVPIIISVVIWFVINDIASWVGRVQIGNFRIPEKLTLWVAIALIALAALILGRMLINTAVSIVNEFDTYEKNLLAIVQTIPSGIWESIGITDQSVLEDVGQLLAFVGNSLSAFVGTIAGQVVNFVIQGVIVFFYVLFLIMEQGNFGNKMRNLVADPKRSAETQEIISSISTQIQKYISVKTYVSFMTGLGSFIIMLIFGLENALFWALLIFLFNYIPYIGSIVAVVFPVIMGLLQFGNWGTVIALLALLFIIQIAVGYIIEPMVMGNSLGISAFVVLASLSVFSAIWGITGMILAVPIVIIMIIVFSHFEVTRPLAVLMSGNGDIGELET